MHDFYSSHVHQMANQARQSPPESSNNNIHTTSPVSNSIHNPSTSYYHHYHSSSAVTTNNNPIAGYSPTQNTGHNGNESPNSVDQFTSNNNNNIQLPETPNSLIGTTLMGPTSGNSNSNDATNPINESASSENATIIANNNNNYSPWCSSSGHHQLPLSNSPIHSSSYNSAHHPSASLYSAAAAHHNLLPHQNISSFVQHPQKGFNHHHLSQPFYSWY